MRWSSIKCLGLLLWLLPSASGNLAGNLSRAQEPAGDDPRVSIIAAVLQERCAVCHGPNKQAGGYRLDTFALMRMAGDSQLPPVVPSQPQESELIRRVSSADPDIRMPPEGHALAEQDVQLITAWIEDGARLPADSEAAPLVALSALTMRAKSPEHYSVPLPVADLCLNASRVDLPQVWTSGYGEALGWQMSDDQQMKLLARQPVTGVHVTKLSFSHSHQLLAVASGSPGAQGVVEVFDVQRLPSQPIWTHRHIDLAGDVAFAPDSSLLAIGQSDGSLLVADVLPANQVGEQKLAVQITPHADAILSLAWSSDGQRLITGSRDRTAKLFRAPQLELIANYDRHERAVGGVGMLDDKPVSLDETGRLRLWAGDDSDKLLTDTDTRVRFLENIVARQGHLWLADTGSAREYVVEEQRVDDGQDEAGKPKQKTVRRWHSPHTYASNQASWILAVDSHNGWLAGGTEGGTVWLWKLDAPQAAASFAARP